MSNLTIRLRQSPWLTDVLNEETGEHFLGAMAFTLTATPGGTDIKLITDREVFAGPVSLEGEWSAPVSEQLVLGNDFLSMLAKLVAQELHTTHAYHEERDAKLRVWYDELELRNETFIHAVADEVERRLARTRQMSEGGGGDQS